MPDGHQDRPYTHPFANPQTLTPQGFNIPGADARPAGGVARAIAFARGISGKAVMLALGVFALQAVMPEGRRPSDLIGSFHGSTETAEIRAKQEAAVDYERRMADAKSGPPADWQIEQMTAQTQLQERAKSYEMQEQAAQLADLACMGSAFVTALFGDTPDARAWRDGLREGCGTGDAIRDHINSDLARAARQGSGIVPRGAALPPPLSGAAERR